MVGGLSLGSDDAVRCLVLEIAFTQVGDMGGEDRLQHGEVDRVIARQI